MWKRNDSCVATIIENEEAFKGTDIESAPFFICIGNKNKPPAMQACSQKALASRKNLHVIMSLRFANQIQYNKEVSEWITTVYHTQNGHANII